MTRFLRYSLEHGRKIRAVLLWKGALAQKTVLVVSYTHSQVTLLVGGAKKPVTLPLSDLFSCDYARGDHGEE